MHSMATSAMLTKAMQKPSTEYRAMWYENDEYDQWMEFETFKDLDEAKIAAFKGANKLGTHLYCEVDVMVLGKYGWNSIQTYVNHHDFRTSWSGWITEEKYKRNN